MNEYWLQEQEDDYRFIYMGGHGTFTPFHADVYRYVCVRIMARYERRMTERKCC